MFHVDTDHAAGNIGQEILQDEALYLKNEIAHQRHARRQGDGDGKHRHQRQEAGIGQAACHHHATIFNEAAADETGVLEELKGGFFHEAQQ